MFETIHLQAALAIATAIIAFLSLSVVHLLRERNRLVLSAKHETSQCEKRLEVVRLSQDSLLQSLHILVLRFHCAAEAIRADDPARFLIKDELERADLLVLKARQGVEISSDNGESSTDLRSRGNQGIH